MPYKLMRQNPSSAASVIDLVQQHSSGRPSSMRTAASLYTFPTAHLLGLLLCVYTPATGLEVDSIITAEDDLPNCDAHPGTGTLNGLGSGTTAPFADVSCHVPQANNSCTSVECEAQHEYLLGVDLPVSNSTKSFWLNTPGANPLAEAGSQGEITQDADVCVIGSGITGVSAAWHLARTLRGNVTSSGGDTDEPKIVIIEAREFCSGATGRNGGHLVRNVFSHFVARESIHNTSEAVKTYLLEKHTAEDLVNFILQRNLQNKVDLVEGGRISLFATEEEELNAKKDYEAAMSVGLDPGGVRWITNEELRMVYGLSPTLNYTGVWFVGHNLWPCKLVTELLYDAQSVGHVSLHTKTPVTSISPVQDFDSQDQQHLSGSPKNRRWTLHTPRGDIQCSYVVHATNAYAGHLLPFLSDNDPDVSRFATNAGGAPVVASGDNADDLRTANGRRRHVIVPTRGQVGAVRATADPSVLGWLNAWDGNEGFEYWFPRYQDTRGASGETRNPLIILGGGRESSGGRLEMNTVDDSVLNPHVSKALRGFLPALFPDYFTTDESSWEMEWTGIMGFTESDDPYVGPVGPLVGENVNNQLDGQYIAAGYSGHGMPRAYACAEAVAGMIVADMLGTQWDTPEWLPASYLTNWKDEKFIIHRVGHYIIGI